MNSWPTYKRATCWSRPPHGNFSPMLTFVAGVATGLVLGWLLAFLRLAWMHASRSGDGE